MTLLEIATLAAEKVRHSEAEDLALCKKFVRVRYRELFSAHLWRDSLASYAFILDPTGAAGSPTGSNAALTALAGQGIYLLPSSVDRVLAVRTATLDSVPTATELTGDNPPLGKVLSGRDMARFWSVDYDRFQDTGEAWEHLALPAVAGLSLSNDTVTVAAGSDADAGATVTVEWVSSLTNERYTTAVTLLTAGSTVAIGNARDILSVSHEALVGDLTVAVAGATLFTVPAGQTAAPLRVPVQMLPKPEEMMGFRALVKRQPLPLAADNDRPDIRGIAPVLLDYAVADMREWAGQVATAQASKQAGDARLASLMATEVVNADGNPRIVPEQGFGPYPQFSEMGIEGWTRP